LALCYAGSSEGDELELEGVMELIKRLGSFIAGGVLGAGVGAAVAMVVAPQSGEEFVEGVERRVDQAKRAGLEAQVRTEEELIRRFRAETGDPDALRDHETLTRVETAQAIADLGLAPDASSVRDTSGA
jgi:gas vesicle protein